MKDLKGYCTKQAKKDYQKNLARIKKQSKQPLPLAEVEEFLNLVLTVFFTGFLLLIFTSIVILLFL